MEQMSEIEKNFTYKYDNNTWLGKESRSGPGSSLSVNTLLLNLLEEFIKNNNILNIVDCGCGDFNWMKHMNFSFIESYVGIDIVAPLIEENNFKYSNSKIKFIKSNIIIEDIPNSDMVICKDVLFHLSFNDALKVLENIKKSNVKFFVSTTFYDFKNIDIITGDWRPINLEMAPFLLGKPMLLWKNIENKKEKWISKSIGVWCINT
jgi:2-polyprenyl-3-methyl-5-hydroxy-6-metoxy-1,4-benzoquinol methylase